jgi:hypothetical protein
MLATAREAVAEPSARRRLLGGGADGNEQLTAIIAVVLTVLLLVIGVTILRIGQLISIHLFIGLLLIGPVVAKLGSTGYRMIRYYARKPEYVRRGPPELYLRLSAPLLVLLTIAVFVSGVVLMFLGPADRGSWVSIHKVTFFAWAAMFAIHFLGHLAEMPRALAGAVRRYGAGGTPGDSGRWITLAGALVAGAVLAIVLIPDFHSWTAAGAFPHHHHH